MHIKSFLTLYLYKILTIFVSPLGAAFIAYKKRKDAPYGKRIVELLGCYKDKTTDCVWFHGASVGEVIALKPLIKEFINNNPHENVVLTTMTSTGLKAATGLDNVKVVYSPLDSPIGVCGFFKAFRPKLLVIIDTELWPNILDKAHKNKVSVLIVNARMQEKNCVNYLKHKTLVNDLISTKLSKVMCISHADKIRFEKIGCKSDDVIVTGNLKYDLSPRDYLFEKAKQDKNNLKDYKIFGAISTHVGEESHIIDAFLEAKKDIPNLKLLYVGRHTNDCMAAIEYITRSTSKLSYQKRSDCPNINEFKSDILIGDTLGEIEYYFGLCDLVFMGGSFVDIGGHNPLEPAYFSLPIITGPDYHNFEEEYEKMIEHGGAFVATNSLDLSSFIKKFITNPAMLEKIGVKALDIQHSGKGTLKRNLEIIKSYL